MGAVVSFDPETPDLLPSEDRTRGAELADAVAKYLKNALANLRIAYMQKVMDSGGAFDRNGCDFAKCRQILNTVDETSESIHFLNSRRAKPGDPSAFTFTHQSPFRMFEDRPEPQVAGTNFVACAAFSRRVPF
ncbi:hypothetical protein [uncultured Tateyamaria sp.]|uniref:hypothetical protein n=1 Tax=Tateyamaria sp. 1078 TaxID=3417464 RepID=UPI002637B36A|nr:hypothetical protein [uncultured Tateyamaria sp.]